MSIGGKRKKLSKVLPNILDLLLILFLFFFPIFLYRSIITILKYLVQRSGVTLNYYFLQWLNIFLSKILQHVNKYKKIIFGLILYFSLFFLYINSKTYLTSFQGINDTRAPGILGNESKKTLDDKNYNIEENKKNNMLKGIDISKYQDKIIWEDVSLNDIDFVMIKIGDRDFETRKMKLDPLFEYNWTSLLYTNLDFGYYFVSTAVSKKEIKEEVEFIFDNIFVCKGMPLAISWGQEKPPSDCKIFDISKEKACELMEYFCKLIKKAGYEPLIYLNENWLDNFEYDFKYSLWISAYNRKIKPKIRKLKMWQYTDSGIVDGISGNVNLNYYYD